MENGKAIRRFNNGKTVKHEEKQINKIVGYMKKHQNIASLIGKAVRFEVLPG